MQINNDQYLFHYTKLDILKNIIEKGLRFNSVCKQADYHEGKYRSFKTTRSYWKDDTREEAEQIKNEFSLPFEQMQIISLSRNGVPKIEKYYDQDKSNSYHYFDLIRDSKKNNFVEIQDIVDNINNQYVFETKGYYNNYMWERYGDKHNGICLILDKSNLLNEFMTKYDSTAKHGIVEYKSNEITNNINNKNNEHIHLFQKDLTYSHENEYRLLLHKTLDYENRDFVGKDSIVGVIVGFNLEMEIKKNKANKIINESINLDIYKSLNSKINFYCIQKDWPGKKSDYDVFEI